MRSLELGLLHNPRHDSFGQCFIYRHEFSCLFYFLIFVLLHCLLEKSAAKLCNLARIRTYLSYYTDTYHHRTCKMCFDCL